MSSPPRDLEQLCAEMYPDLVGLLSLHSGDRQSAEDASQTALARLCERWHKVSGYPNPRGWVYRVALNAARDQFRRRRREADSQPAEVAAPVDQEGRTVDALDVRSALARLPQRERETLLLRYFADLSVDEAAAVLGCPANTIKTITRRAIQQLRAEGIVNDVEVQHG